VGESVAFDPGSVKRSSRRITPSSFRTSIGAVSARLTSTPTSIRRSGKPLS